MRAPFHSLIDVRRIEGIDADAFSYFSGYVVGRGAALATRVARQAILRPQGVIGALTAGFCPVFAAPYQATILVKLEEALEWIGRTDGALLAKEVEQRVELATGTPELLRRFRTLVAERYATLTLEEAAHVLALSDRTLQRRLTEAKTSFRDEVNTVRFRRACELLVETEHTVTAVALEVGCASVQHLGVLFKRETGMAPSEWRNAALTASPSGPPRTDLRTPRKE